MRIITLSPYEVPTDPIIDRRAIWMTRPFDLQFQFVETCPPRMHRQGDDCCDTSLEQPLRRPDDCE